MLRNNKGYFLLELLLSLSAMFMVCLFFIPLLMDLRDQSMTLEIEKKARQIMYEELQAKLNGSQTFTNRALVQNGVEYRIDWRNTDETGQKEVRVSADGKTGHSKIEIYGKLE